MMDASKKVKKISKTKRPRMKAKDRRKHKKKVVAELHNLRDILGQEKAPDEQEKELQNIVLGYESDDLEELDRPLEYDKPKKKKKVAAWKDDDDETILVKEKAKDLKNCHRSMLVRGEEKYSNFVEEKFKKLVGAPKWAEIKSNEDGNLSDDSGDELLQRTGNIIASSKALQKGTLKMRKCPSLVDENFKGTIVKSFEFHPTARVALVASTSGTVNLFQIDGKINSKIQSVHFDNFPIHTAHFSADGNEIVVGSNKFGHFFAYDMISGKTQRIPWDRGMEQQNIRKFQLSPDGKFIAIHGKYGNIHLVTAKTKEWIGSLKMNGDVVAITFSKDGSKLYSHGTAGEIYVWDLSSRKCLHKFVDEGCITGTSLVVSPNDQFIASGSDSGVVNIYDHASAMNSKSPNPLKTVMNLTTEVSNMKYNHSTELLAVSSCHKPFAIKLVHFPSMTVFSNFPLKENIAMKYVNALDISVNSGYFGIRNNVGTTYIYRLKHFVNY